MVKRKNREKKPVIVFVWIKDKGVVSIHISRELARMLRVFAILFETSPIRLVQEAIRKYGESEKAIEKYLRYDVRNGLHDKKFLKTS